MGNWQKLQRYRRCSMFIVICIFLLSSSSIFAKGNNILDEKRLQAIELARNGESVQAILIMKEILKTNPDDLKTVYDLIVIHAWIDEHENATSLAQDFNLLEQTQTPKYVLIHLAQSYRHLKNFQQARKLYRQLAIAEPNEISYTQGYILTFIDEGRFNDAEELITKLTPSQKSKPEILLALAYLNYRLENHVEAISYYQRLLEHRPNDSEIHQAIAVIISDIGGLSLSHSMAMQTPDHYPNEMRRRFAGNAAIAELRWGRLYDDNDVRRKKHLATAEEKIAILKKNKALNDDEKWRNIFDEVIIFHAQMNMKAVLEAYEELKKSNVELPDYVKNAVADAYLAEEYPEKALEIYHQTNPDNNNSFQSMQAFFYSQAESGNVASALERAKNYLKTQPKWRTAPGLKQPLPNHTRISAETTIAFAHAYNNNLEIALEQLKRLSGNAPINADLRTDYATIARWRGWHELALEELKIASTIEPTNQNTLVALANIYLDLGEYPKAFTMVDELSIALPDFKPVKSLQQRKEDLLSWRIEQSGEYAENSNGSAFGTTEQSYKAKLQGPRQHYYWIPYYAHDYFTADFQEKEITWSRDLLGISYDRQRNHIDFALSYDRDGKLSINTSLSKWFNDHVHLFAGHDRNSSQVALRARDQDIGGKDYSLGFMYRWHEGAQIIAAIRLLELTDGNDRISTSIVGRRNLFSNARFFVDGSFELSSSKNSSSQGPYFAPEKDRFAEYKLNITWISWQDYQRSLKQHLQLGIADYWQKGFGKDETYSIGYEHEWNLGSRLYFNYGINRSKHVYDGDSEYTTSIFANLGWLF